VLSQKVRKAEVKQLFNRTSKFDFDEKKNKWEDKIRNLELGYFEKGKWIKSHNVTINMGLYID